jgi:hypothetical protein
MHMATWPHHATVVHGSVCVKWVLHNITPTHKGEHEVMSIQTIIMMTSTHMCCTACKQWQIFYEDHTSRRPELPVQSM